MLYAACRMQFPCSMGLTWSTTGRRRDAVPVQHGLDLVDDMSIMGPPLASAAPVPPTQTHFMQQPAGDELPGFPPQAQAHTPYGQQQLYVKAPYGQQQQVQAPYSQSQYYSPQQRATAPLCTAPLHAHAGAAGRIRPVAVPPAASARL